MIAAAKRTVAPGDASYVWRPALEQSPGLIRRYAPPDAGGILDVGWGSASMGAVGE